MIPRRSLAGAVLAVVFAGALNGTALAAEPARRPNVVLILTDDQGYGDLGCHGNTVLQTPNLDKLHGQSVRLTNYHVDPTCSPTRSALMTGRYSSRTGVWHTVMGRSLLRRDEVTMADVFAAGGYRTGLFGKWHLGDNYPFRPQDRGFREVLTHGGGGIGQTPDFWGNNYFDNTLLHNGKWEKVPGYCTDVFFDHALKFIEQNKERPFFVYLTPNAPHVPLNVAEKYSRPYLDKGLSAPLARFYGMIANIDENVARLTARLKELGLEDDTILIFATDNGSATGAGSGGFNAGMRANKGSEYDGGHRVPCFWRWPAGLKGGRDVGRLTAHIDVLPTLIDLCGLQKPEGVSLDGASLRPLLAGDGKWPERTLFVHSQRIDHPEKGRKCAVMTDRWRLVNGEELYDMTADPGQKKNVVKEHPDVAAGLRQAYDGWWADLSRRFDEYCEIVVGSEKENPSRLCCHDWHGPAAPSDQQALLKAPQANGFWAIEVARAGKYEIALRQLPAEANTAIQADRARVKVGDVEADKPVPDGATSVTFTVELKAGKCRLQTWLSDSKKGVERGAFYVEVKYLP
jgi:arylsulfatase A-like enzyme